MVSLFNKKSIILTVVALSLTLMVGCSSTIKPLSNTTNSNKSKSEVSSNVVTKSPKNNSCLIQQQENSQKILLENIKKLALQGKINNCDFPVKSTDIETVQEKWGRADKSQWVPQAKGIYDTYSKYNVVFGYNKGDQIFEVRSLDSQLGQISLSMVKKVFGTPAYDVKFSGEEIIGYTAGKEFKILFVFSPPKKGGNDSVLHHYSILYPVGTVNMMADDPGRKW